MKSLLLILVMVLVTTMGFGVQPLRKPFTQIRVDGKPSKSGDILTVKPGQKLLIEVELEGGRRDFCKFPDIYADIAGTAQILSRGEKGIVYQLDGEKAEWKLTSEQTLFEGDEFVQIKNLANPLNAEVLVSDKKFSQCYVKITAKTSWQFTQNGKTKKEENVAEQTLYFKVAGESDVWFSTRNVQAKGIRNDKVQEKLQEVQAVGDSIETNFYRLNFAAVQQSIRNLQNAVNALKSAIDEVTATNPAYKTKVVFIGLPSDNPFKDLGLLPAISTSWAAQEAIVNDQKLRLENLPAQATIQGRDEMVKLISTYADWQNKLPESTFKILARYMPGLNAETIRLPESFSAIAKQKSVDNYPQALTELTAFVDQRQAKVPEEIQLITSTQGRLQAVRLFDGMLRSYMSSIYWGEWKDTRQ